MDKLTVALLAGGNSSEREVSLHSGEQVYEALDKDKYNILTYDPKTDLSRLMQDASKIDIALIILHAEISSWLQYHVVQPKMSRYYLSACAFLVVSIQRAGDDGFALAHLFDPGA